MYQALSHLGPYCKRREARRGPGNEAILGSRNLFIRGRGHELPSIVSRLHISRPPGSLGTRLELCVLVRPHYLCLNSAREERCGDVENFVWYVYCKRRAPGKFVLQATHASGNEATFALVQTLSVPQRRRCGTERVWLARLLLQCVGFFQIDLRYDFRAQRTVTSYFPHHSHARRSGGRKKRTEEWRRLILKR